MNSEELSSDQLRDAQYQTTGTYDKHAKYVRQITGAYTGHSYKEDASAILLFPNNTRVSITGDIEVVTQIIKALDGINIEFRA